MIHFLRAVVGLNEAMQAKGSAQSQAHSRNEGMLATRLGPWPSTPAPRCPRLCPSGVSVRVSGPLLV